MEQNKNIHSQAEISDDFMEWEERDTTSISLFKHCIAGSLAGISEHLGLYPVDTLKTHMQAGGSNLGFMRTAKILLKEEGIIRFWKGANVVASGCIPAHAGQFCAYEVLKEKLDMKNESYDLFNNLAIGATTTFAHDFFIAPSDVLKQRLQLCKNLTARQSFNNIIQQDGVRGLFRSYPITVFMNVPFQSVVVCVNENMKTWIKPWEKQNPHFWYFVCAGVAGGIAGVITNPIDVVKTRLQTQNLQPSCGRLVKLWKRELEIQDKISNMGSKQAEEFINSKPSENMDIKNQKVSCNFEEKEIHYRNVFETVSHIYKNEGIHSFTRGMGARMMLHIPSTAVSWGTYELVKGLLTSK